MAKGIHTEPDDDEHSDWLVSMENRADYDEGGTPRPPFNLVWHEDERACALASTLVMDSKTDGETQVIKLAEICAIPNPNAQDELAAT